MPAPTLSLATVGLAPPAQCHTGAEFLAPLVPKSHYQVTEGQGRPLLWSSVLQPGPREVEQELNEGEAVSIPQPCISGPHRVAETNRSLPSNLCLLATAWIKTERAAPCHNFWWTFLKIGVQKMEARGASLSLNPVDLTDMYRAGSAYQALEGGGSSPVRGPIG